MGELFMVVTHDVRCKMQVLEKVNTNGEGSGLARFPTPFTARKVSSSLGVSGDR